MSSLVRRFVSACMLAVTVVLLGSTAVAAADPDGGWTREL